MCYTVSYIVLARAASPSKCMAVPQCMREHKSCYLCKHSGMAALVEIALCLLHELSNQQHCRGGAIPALDSKFLRHLMHALPMQVRRQGRALEQYGRQHRIYVRSQSASRLDKVNQAHISKRARCQTWNVTL